MEPTNPDANTELESSTARIDDKDQTGAPSTSGEPQQTPPKEPTMLDAVKAKLAKADSDPEPKKAADSALDSPVESNGAKEPGKEEPPVLEEHETEKPPFHEHPAWKRVLKERDDARALAESTKPLIEKQQEIDNLCKTHNINLQELLEVAVQLDTEPDKALAKLEPIVSALRGLTGKASPTELAPDLAGRVKEGVLDPETAAEINKLRLQNQRLEAQGKRTTQSTAQQQAQQLVANMTTAMNTWDEAKLKTDTDFEKKRDLIQDRWLKLNAVSPVKTVEQAVALCEQAWKEVTESLSKFLPPKPARKALNSNGSSIANPDAAPAKTLLEHVSRVIKEKHGIG